MAGGMVREVDRAIGAISTLLVGLGLVAVRGGQGEEWTLPPSPSLIGCGGASGYGNDADANEIGVEQLRELLRTDKDGQNKWRRFTLGEDGKDVYYQAKYGAPKLPLFQHRGSCDCGALRFFVLAPKRVEAFDDSNTLSCKKGRFPYLVLPTGCFEMVQASGISIYEPEATTAQHVFCGKCGVHIFHFDHSNPEFVAVNLYCVDDNNFEDVKVVFVPKGARPLVGSSRRLPPVLEQAAYRSLNANSLEDQVEGSEESEGSSIAFQKQLMLWSRLDKSRSHSSPISDDTQSTTSSTSQSQRLSLVTEEQANIVDMKHQLEYYLKRHLDDTASINENQTDV
ncbi:hypothetical protein Poli38472_009545 [Pythium oligandrum]|uniref:CENP-V/GFA domain-containing protein n=1 Tax=Pythium oligandrum TaxID=41045 RepID=A0A8K1CH54_PYTOL|nr:hypothetical protein Poli38472_009545 [Pythium oligandrum]|eukprot:TMW62052.1 hypothetical protein Poli38472_009545 [Pythium oligandrum]